jgi:hypothetical protein
MKIPKTTEDKQKFKESVESGKTLSPFLEGYEQINQNNPVTRGSTALVMDKEQQKQLITEIMDLDAKDGLYDTVSELDKLAEKTFKGDDATTFVQREIWKDGYRKAKETLYTEEQVNQKMIDFAEWCRTQYKLNGDVFLIEQLLTTYKSLK